MIFLLQEPSKTLPKGFPLPLLPGEFPSLVLDASQQDLQAPAIQPGWIQSKKLLKTQHKAAVCAHLRHVGDEEGQPSHEEHAQEDAQRQAGLQRLLAVLVGESPALAATRGLGRGLGDLQWDMRW